MDISSATTGGRKPVETHLSMSGISSYEEVQAIVRQTQKLAAPRYHPYLVSLVGQEPVMSSPGLGRVSLGRGRYTARIRGWRLALYITVQCYTQLYRAACTMYIVHCTMYITVYYCVLLNTVDCTARWERG